MLPLKFLPLLVAIFFCSPIKKNQDAHALKNKVAGKSGGDDILLVYTGENSYGNTHVSVGIQLIERPSLGLRKETTVENGEDVISHIAIFFKKSNPAYYTSYNYFTHHAVSHNISSLSGNSKNLSIIVIGNETVDGYPCTHLQHTDPSGEGATTDIWMSKKVPGYNMLNKIPMLGVTGVSGSAYDYGGLVKLTVVSTNPEPGQSSLTSISLKEANPTMNFPSSTFDVPSH